MKRIWQNFSREILQRIIKGSRRAPRKQPGQFESQRSRLIFCGFALVFAVLAGRAVVIHLFPAASENLQTIADRQYHRQLDLAPYRGTIYDRRKEPLAISIRTPSIFINPRVFDPTQGQIYRVAKLLRLTPKRVKEIANRNNYFAWLKRKVSQDVATRLMQMELNGLFQVMEPARFYPAGAAAAHLIGWVGIDNRGLMGLERIFEKNLRGHKMTVTKSRDARGRTIFLQSDHAVPEKSGQNIYLTIDRAIQEITEKALAEGLKNAKAKSGFAIVSDPHTGRILALANYPLFDPNNIRYIDMKHTTNHALTDVYEPGSVVKPFVIGEALTQGKTTLDEMHDCENGSYQEGSFRIHDSHKAQELSTTDVIVHSSNICTYKIAKRLGPEEVYKAYKKFGFATNNSLVDFPGQNIGRISDWHNWRPIRFANIAFGQGLVATGLEVVQAYGSIANGGNLMKPYFVDHIESPDGTVISSQNATTVRRVFSPELAKSLREVLAQVVERGSLGNAKMVDYTSAGKTGTSEKVDPKTKAYSSNLRIASFAGFTPVNDPHLVIYVVVDEPGIKPYYGAKWAAPIFKVIAEQSLRYLNVAPDRPGSPTDGPRIARGLLESPTSSLAQ